MKVGKLIVAVVMLGSTTGVLAQEQLRDGGGLSQSRTRAEVAAEVLRARTDGTLDINEHTYPGPIQNSSTKSRVEVTSGRQKAQADGILSYRDTNFPHVLVSSSRKSSNQVRQDFTQYRNGFGQHEQSLYSGS